MNLRERKRSNYGNQKRKQEERFYLNLRELFRWHAWIIVKSNSKNGLKANDWKFENEKNKVKKNPKYDPKVKEWIDKMDKNIKNRK